MVSCSVKSLFGSGGNALIFSQGLIAVRRTGCGKIG
jgi:hypothetical protein